jgi:hypothetical protein
MSKEDILIDFNWFIWTLFIIFTAESLDKEDKIGAKSCRDREVVCVAKICSNPSSTARDVKSPLKSFIHKKNLIH